MPRRLVAINVVLAAVSVLCIALIVKQLAVARPTAAARGRAPVASSAEPAIAGGTVQTISADAVVISRPDGMVDVRLRDPSKPRPTPLPTGQAGAPGQPPLPGQSPAGGQLPNQGLMPVPGPGVPSPRPFTPSG